MPTLLHNFMRSTSNKAHKALINPKEKASYWFYSFIISKISPTLNTASSISSLEKGAEHLSLISKDKHEKVTQNGLGRQ